MCAQHPPTGDVIVSDVFEEVRFFDFLQTGDVPGHMPHEVASLVACVPLGNIQRLNVMPYIMLDTCILIGACSNQGLFFYSCVSVACTKRITATPVDD